MRSLSFGGALGFIVCYAFESSHESKKGSVGNQTYLIRRTYGRAIDSVGRWQSVFCCPCRDLKHHGHHARSFRKRCGRW